MDGMALIIASAFLMGLCMLALLVWTMNSGQYDDLEGDANRILLPDDNDR
ncbi:MAG: cbb3-type cytochrome oxidase assembly protein CcoS [Proteobacteria bacterium]|nr:cbb3-type cytochrome oxidase assembly protein CcoS [Pseudomonadota bacterium]